MGSGSWGKEAEVEAGVGEEGGLQDTELSKRLSGLLGALSSCSAPLSSFVMITASSLRGCYPSHGRA